MPATRSSSFSQHEVRALFKSAHSVIVTSFLEIRKAPAQKDPCRILIVTPKRVGNAVQRNRLRRRCKELFKNHKPQGHDFLVLAKSPEATQLSFQQLEQIFQQALAHG